MNTFKRLLNTLFITILILSSIYVPSVSAKYVYKWTNIKEIQITANTLNIRTGPSTAFPVIGKVSQNQVVEVIGTLGSWFVIHLDNDMIGCVSSTWTRIYSYHNNNTSNSTIQEPSQNNQQLTSEEQHLFNLVNSERKKKGLATYKIDSEIER